MNLFKDRPYLYLFEQAFEGDLQPDTITNVAELNERFSSILVEEFEENMFNPGSHYAVPHFYELLEFGFQKEIEYKEYAGSGKKFHTFTIYKDNKFLDDVKVDFSPQTDKYTFDAIKFNLYSISSQYEIIRTKEGIEKALNENSKTDDFKHFLFQINSRLFKLFNINQGGVISDVNDGILSLLHNILNNFISFQFEKYNQYINSSHQTKFKNRSNERNFTTHKDKLFKEQIDDLANYNVAHRDLEFNLKLAPHKIGWYKDFFKTDATNFFNIETYHKKLQFWNEMNLNLRFGINFDGDYFGISPSTKKEYETYNKFVIKYCDEKLNDGTDYIYNLIYKYIDYNYNFIKKSFDELKKEFITKYKRAPRKEYLVKDEIKKLHPLKIKTHIKPIFEAEYDLVAKGKERNLKDYPIDFPKFYINLAIRPYVEYLVWLESNEYENSYKKDIENLKKEISQKPLKLFISYAQEDESYLNEFQKHLKPLKRAGLIEEWNDKAIMPGDEWDKKIKSQVEQSDIIVFLVSPDFIASDYINDIEVKKAIKRFDRGEIIIIPVLIRTSDFNSLPISTFQALPKRAIPVSNWDDKDAAWQNVIDGLRNVAESIKTGKTLLNDKYVPPVNGSVKLKDSEIEKLKDEIANGKIKPVINQLLEIHDNDRDKRNNLILLSSRYNHIHKKEIMGTVPDDVVQINKNRITESLLELIDGNV